MPLKESVTIDEAIALLNEAVDLDADAMHRLVNKRVRCNAALADHPAIQVLNSAPSAVGLLGILNGLFGVDERGWGAITAVYDGEKLAYFIRSKVVQNGL